MKQCMYISYASHCLKAVAAWTRPRPCLVFIRTNRLRIFLIYFVFCLFCEHSSLPRINGTSMYIRLRKAHFRNFVQTRSKVVCCEADSGRFYLFYLKLQETCSTLSRVKTMTWKKIYCSKVITGYETANVTATLTYNFCTQNNIDHQK